MVSESEASKLKMHADVGDNGDMSVGMKTGWFDDEISQRQRMFRFEGAPCQGARETGLFRLT